MMPLLRTISGWLHSDRIPGKGPFAKGTLTRRLILRTAAIMAALAVALGVTTSVAMQRIMIRQIDESLAINQAAFWGDSKLRPTGHAVTGPGETGLEVKIRDGVLLSAWVYGHGVASGLSLGQVTLLHAVASGGVPVTMDIPGLGEWRVSREVRTRIIANTLTTDEYVVGMPTRGLYDFTKEVVLLEAVVTLIVIIIAAVVVNVVVSNSLRPLSQMADTAERVAQMNLGRGEARIAERVPVAAEDADSEVGQVALALNTMLDNVDDALVARQASETKLRQFIADASHELRNPLASIRGYAELTRRGRESLPSDTGFALTRIESESSRMSKLVDDMLLLARLDAGRNPNFEPVDITELLVNAVSDAQAAGQEHEWSVSVPDAPVLVSADREQLHQVLANLLSNARKHTPVGTAVEATLYLTGTPSPRYATLTITDNGPGIAPETLPTIFERFTRADVARTHTAEASTGLGLSIVSAVVESHGGKVWAESTPGCTTFTVLLPVLPPLADNTEAE
ncbi:MAG: HAMP domain-containing histidine kinase [Propionibacteriaceae bacterium]|jgi:two-component system OmpR family sensor kinase|nr:HAMP domain-containing histidine kinase [Propionibacteriaceae bacterium]